MNQRLSFFLKAAVLLAVPFAIYWRSRKGQFLLDDAILPRDSIMQGNWVTQLKVRAGRQLTWASYAMNVRQWGAVETEQDVGPRERALYGFHIVNMALHALNGLLVWFIYHRLGRKNAWLSAMTFAVHPLAVPSVAYVSGRAGVLAATCGFGSLALMASNRALVSVIPFGLACLSKEDSGMMLPAIYTIGKIQKTRFRSILPMVALAGLWKERVAIRNLLHQTGDEGMQQTGFPRQLPSPDYQATASTELLKRLPFWAIGQKQCGDPQLKRWTWQDPAALVFPALYIMMAIVACQKREGRIATAWILGSPLFLYPFVPMPDPVFEYRAYFTLGGMAYGYGAILDRYPALAGPLWAYLGVQSIRRAESYRTDRTFWEASLRDGGRTDRGLINKGVALWNESAEAGQKRTLAKIAFTEALSQNPDLAIARSNLGSMLKDEGRFDEALAHLLETVRRTPTNFPSWYLLGIVYEKMNRWEDAEASYVRCIEISPTYAPALNRLGLVSVVKLADFQRAERLFQRAIDANQHKVEVDYVYNHAWTLHMLGRHEEHVRELATLPPQIPTSEHMLKVRIEEAVK